MTVPASLNLDGYNFLGLRRPVFDEWLLGEGLNGPLRITEMTMIGPRQARVVVPIHGRREIHHIEIVVNLTSDPPADVLAWNEAA